MRRLKSRHLIAVVVALLVALYVGSYVCLSARGRYEPAAIGLNGVKWYDWAPQGFVSDFRWSPTLMRVYYPLYILDIRSWHTSDKADDGNYPVNEVSQEEIGKVYRAWD